MWDYGNAHAMSEIITQADVRIDKHDTHSLDRQKCEVQTLFLTDPYSIFLSCKLWHIGSEVRYAFVIKCLPDIDGTEYSC